jgi:hypothetical protein
MKGKLLLTPRVLTVIRLLAHALKSILRVVRSKALGLLPLQIIYIKHLVVTY